MPLNQSRDTRKLAQAEHRDLPVAAGVKIFQGALVVMAAGLVRPGRVAAGDVAIGRAVQEADNSAGAAGALMCRMDTGTFKFRNATAGDALTLADIGSTCFVLDDDQVAKTNPGGNTRSVAGRVWNVEADGVWVTIA